MLNQVPTAINRASRLVVLRHPNAMPCTVLRKQVLRTETIGGNPSAMGGMPTLGGIGVINSEDETEYEYQELGTGMCLFIGPYMPTSINERDDAILPANMQEARIECNDDGRFVTDKSDLVVIDLGRGVSMSFTVEDVVGNVAIPPYVRKLVLNPRDELDALAAFQ